MVPCDWHACLKSLTLAQEEFPVGQRKNWEKTGICKSNLSVDNVDTCIWALRCTRGRLYASEYDIDIS